MKLHIGTFNICHCGDYEHRKATDPVWVREINVECTANRIKQLNFDIIGLNEVYFTGYNENCVNQEKRLADIAGYPYVAGAVGAKDGVVSIGNGLLSRYPIVHVEKIAVDTIPESEREEEGWYEPRVLLIADIDVNGEIVRVLVSHFGCILKEREKIVGKICELTAKKSIDVVMGDFNALPDAEELKPLYKNWISTAQATGNTECTFASYDPKICIDYIFVNKKFGIDGYTVHKVNTSDHFPISTNIEIKR